MKETLGILIEDENLIILEYNEGHTETFNKEKPNYSIGSQWITWKGERYFLNKDLNLKF